MPYATVYSFLSIHRVEQVHYMLDQLLYKLNLCPDIEYLICHEKKRLGRHALVTQSLNTIQSWSEPEDRVYTGAG